MSPVAFDRRTGDDCISDFAFDKLVGGLLSPDEKERVQTHVAACPSCRTRFEVIAQAQTAFANRPIPIAIARVARSRVRKRLYSASAAVGFLAVAAALFFMVRPPETRPDERIKGSGHSFGFEILRAGRVAGNELSGTAHPGDTLQWRFGLRQRAYVAVLSRDGSGKASVYFPLADRAAAVEPAESVPIATELDAVLGRETVYGVICTTPIELAPLRKELELTATLHLPKECDFEQYAFVKTQAK